MAVVDPKHAEAVMLKAGLKPLEPYTNSTTKWKCLHIQCGRTVDPTYSTIRRGRGGCIPCGYIKTGNARRMPEKKAIAIMLKAGMKPLEPYKNALSRWKCICLTCGHIGSPTFNSVNNGQGGCRPCSYIKTGMAIRITEKEARSRLKEQKLQVVGKYEWHDNNDLFEIKCLICKKNSKTSWDTLSKKGRQTGCRTCSRKAASFLQVTEEMHIQLLSEHNLESIGKYTGNHDLLSVKCLVCYKKKKVRRSFLQQRKNKMLGCMTCAGAPVADPKKIERVMRKAKLEPLVPYSGNHQRWKCKCLKCGETVYPAFNSILQGQGGCIYCAEIGFNYKEPAYFYIIFHAEFDSIKVGITNTDSKPDRLKHFQKYGWEIHQKYNFKIGNDAFKIETEILRWIRKDLKLPVHLSTEEMPKTGGHSETVDADLISVVDIRKKVDQIIKGLQE